MARQEFNAGSVFQNLETQVQGLTQKIFKNVINLIESFDGSKSDKLGIGVSDVSTIVHDQDAD